MQEDFIAIQDMQKMEGWNLFTRELKERRERAIIDLRNIKREGRTLQDIGAEYVTLVERINSYDQALSIADDIKGRVE